MQGLMRFGWSGTYEDNQFGHTLIGLTRGGLFSSRNDRALLVYGEDFNKMSWAPERWPEAACSLLRLQQRVQANGKTLWKGRQDKGHRAAVAAFRAAVTGTAAMPTGVTLASMRATIQAAQRAGASE